MLCELSIYCLPVPNVPFDAGSVVNNGIPSSSSLESGHVVKLFYGGPWRDMQRKGLPGMSGLAWSIGGMVVKTPKMGAAHHPL